MFWMRGLNNGATLSNSVAKYQDHEKVKDPNTSRVRNGVVSSAFLAGAMHKMHTKDFKLTNLRRNTVVSFMAIQAATAVASSYSTPIGVGLVATAGTALLGFGINAAINKNSAATIMKGVNLMGNKFVPVASAVTKAENLIKKASKIHPLFKHLATPEGLGIVALLSALPVAHSLIRRAALKISKHSVEHDSPMGSSTVQSSAGYHGQRTSHGAEYKKNIKQQATVAVTGSLISHINTGHLIESFR